MPDKNNNLNSSFFGKKGEPLDRELKEVWDAAAEADELQSFDLPGTEETEDALQDVHIRLGFEDRSGKIAGYINRYSKFFAAAVALLVFGAVLFFTPRSVTAPYGELAEVELPDGSYIELNSGTTVQFNRLYGYTNRTLTLNGEAWFDVETGSEPFVVIANGTVTEVTGTAFVIRSWAVDPSTETQVTVQEGAVQFYPEGFDENAVSLTAGLTTKWDPEKIRPAEPEKADLERATGWRNRKFIFYEEPLLRIFRDIERRFDIEIELQNPDAETETLTGYYRQVESAESLVDDICTVAGLNYSRTANGFRVY